MMHLLSGARVVQRVCPDALVCELGSNPVLHGSVIHQFNLAACLSRHRWLGVRHRTWKDFLEKQQ